MGNTPVTLAVSNVKFQKDYAAIDVFVKVVLPQQITLFFGAEDLQFSYDGYFLGNAKLALLDSTVLVHPLVPALLPTIMVIVSRMVHILIISHWLLPHLL